MEELEPSYIAGGNEHGVDTLGSNSVPQKLKHSVTMSSSINASIFHITWLDTFWTGLVHIKYKKVFVNVCMRARMHKHRACV